LLRKHSTLYRTESIEVDLRNAVSNRTQDRTLRLQAFNFDSFRTDNNDPTNLSRSVEELSAVDDVTNISDEYYDTNVSELQITGILRSQSLDVSYRDTVYPQYVIFYVYGDLNRLHLSHILLKAPNTFIALSNARLEPSWNDLVRNDGKDPIE